VSRRDRWRWTDRSVVVAVCCLVLLAGYSLKSCPSFLSGGRLAFACHTDLTALYTARHIDDHVFPYVHGRLDGDREGGRLTGYDLRLIAGANEYPVLTGLFMWAAGWVADDAAGYLLGSALLLGAVAVVTAWLLAGMAGLRALRFAASPALFLYAFHNWDLLAVAAVVVALVSWRRGSWVLAAAALGVGGAFKLYPMLLVLPFALERWRGGDRRRAIGGAAVAAAAFVVVNVPVLVASPAGWFITYRFHTLRPPNYDSIWGSTAALYDLGPGTLNVVTGSLTAASIIAVLWWSWRHATSEGRFPVVQASAAIVAVFLLWTKVHSPQYALWLLPFFVLLDVRLRWWLFYGINDLILYAAVFVAGTFSVRVLTTVVPAAVFVRAMLLLFLTAVFLRSSVIGRDDRDASTARDTPRRSADPPASVAR
jgi:hypothetical protein